MDQFNQNCCDVLAQMFLNGLNSINTINSNSNRNTNSAYIHCPLDAQYSNLCLMLEKQYWLIWSEPDKNTSRLGPLIRPNTSHTHTHTHSQTESAAAAEASEECHNKKNKQENDRKLIGRPIDG